MIKMKATNIRTEEQVVVTGESIAEAAEMLVQEIIKEGWRGECLKFDLNI